MTDVDSSPLCVGCLDRFQSFLTLAENCAYFVLYQFVFSLPKEADDFTMGKWRLYWKGAVAIHNNALSVCCSQIDPEYFKPPCGNKLTLWRSNKTKRQMPPV